jgi:hypothetical protein
MAEKIKSLKQKLVNNAFSDSYPIGVDAENVDFKDGSTLDKQIDQIKEQFNEKADINHASIKKDFGIGTKNFYGHLKITDEYIKSVEDATNTAISQNGIINMFNKYLLNILKVFYIENDNILFSSLNTGWQTEINKMRLISDYFSITLGSDGNNILVVKDVINKKAIEIFKEKVDDEEQELRFYSYNNAWVIQEAKIRLASDGDTKIEIKSDTEDKEILKLYINN